MPANEFEKQVQQKMDDFQLEPSASVWQKVEEEIRKKKRRRIIFFFVLPAAIALLAFSVYYFTSTSSKNEIVEQPAITTEEKTTDADKNKEEIQSQKQKDKIQQAATNETGLSKSYEKAKTKSSVITQKDDIQILINNPAINRKRNETTKERKEKNKPVKVQQDNLLAITSDLPAKQSVVKQDDDKKDEINKTVTEQVSSNKETDKKDVVTENKDILSQKADSIVSNEIAKNEEKKETLSKKKTGILKIRWGIDFSAGLAGTTEGVFLFPTAKSMRDALYNNPASSGGGNLPSRYNPSSVSIGLSFKIGFSGELQISDKSRFYAGLQYMYASNRIKTGNRRDSSVMLANSNFTGTIDQVYQGTPKYNYTNNYHFIQLPVSYHLQLGKGKKLPVQWNIGLSLGYLIATNGLVYDTSYGGIYFRNKKAFNKTHFNLGTGLSFRMKGKNGAEWILGPELSFDMRRLVNSPFESKQYLLFGGITTRFLFPQKKK